MNKARVEKLIGFMASMPKSAEKHFNMRRWFSHDGAGHAHAIKGKYIQPKDLKHCGTTACALGWATAIPSFRRAGLKVERGDVFDVDSNNRNFARAAKFFDLTTQQSQELFGHPEFKPRQASTPKQWARIARKVIKTWNPAA